MNSKFIWENTYFLLVFDLIRDQSLNKMRKFNQNFNGQIRVPHDQLPIILNAQVLIRHLITALNQVKKFGQ